MKNIALSIWVALAGLIIFVLGAFGLIILNNGSQVLPQSSQSNIEQSKITSQSLKIKVVDNNNLEKNYNYDFNLQETNSLLNVFNVLSLTTNDFKIEYSKPPKIILAVNGYTAKTNESWNIKINGNNAKKEITDITINPGDKVELVLNKTII